MQNHLPFQDEATLVIEHNFVLITFYQPYSLLLLTWKRQISLEERKSGFLQALELIRQHQIQKWLVSDQNLLFISAEEKNWILTDWIELASQSPLLKLAVVSPGDYDHIIGNIGFTSEGQKQYQLQGKIEHRVFLDFSHAFTWVLNKG
jgi:hypothetical protein